MHRLKEKINAFWPTRIWQQIFLVLILFVIVPLAMLGIVLIESNQSTARKSVLRDHRELALRAAGHLNEFVTKPEELLVTVASIIGVSHIDPWRQETAMVELSLRYPMFRRVASVDMKGREIAISQLGGSREDRSDDPAYVKARAGEMYVSPVQIQNRDMPVATMAVPVTQWGKVNGVLVAEVNLRGMWDIVDGIHIGKTGYACVLDRSGVLIAHPDKKLVLEKKNFLGSAVGNLVRAGETGSQEEVDEQGRRWLVSYAPIRNTGWRLMIIQSADEAYAFFNILRARSVDLVILSILAAFMISMVLTRFMSRPLNMLLEGTRRISQKDFEHPLAVHRNDEIGQILASFNAMTAQLKEAHRAEKLSVIGKAATSIVHELKNSLVLVDTYMQLLGERYKDKQFIQEFSRVVPQELNAWKGMLQNMVEYARIPRFAMGKVDVNALIEDIAVLAKMRVKQYDIDLVIEPAGTVPPIHGNAEKLKQVVLNLLSNALESTPAKGTIRIRTDVAEDPRRDGSRYAVVRVENTGEEIPPERLARVFEPFFTTKDGGLGLGLAICREIVEQHKGFIEVMSEPGKGTAFLVYLPLEKGGADVL
jgi:signal transduction histidine kinase